MLKPCFGRVRQNIQNYLNQTLVIGNFLEGGLSDEVEVIFRESDAKPSKPLNSKFGYRKFLRKMF